MLRVSLLQFRISTADSSPLKMSVVKLEIMTLLHPKIA